MHADLSDASVHVPTEVHTPQHHPADAASVSAVCSLPPAVTPEPTEDRAGFSPTYDEIADRALELCMGQKGATVVDLQSWVTAERQLRLERQGRRALFG